MREIRQSGSEGGGIEFNRFSLPLSRNQIVPRPLRESFLRQAPNDNS